MGGVRGMNKSREQMRAKALGEAEAIIEEWLDWCEAAPEARLAEIEEAIVGLRQRFGEQLAGQTLESLESRRSVPGPSCAHCQQEMRYKGQKAVRVESRVGSIKVDRGYYWCAECQEGFFPSG
jgi:hypothetical protein